MFRISTRHWPGPRPAKNRGSISTAPPLRTALRLKFPVIGEYLQQHAELGDEVHRFERKPTLRNIPARMGALHLPPKPFGLAGVGINQAGYPLVPLATRAGFDKAQKIREHIPRGGVTAPERARSA